VVEGSESWETVRQTEKDRVLESAINEGVPLHRGSAPYEVAEASSAGLKRVLGLTLYDLNIKTRILRFQIR
jgi:hypothetical protein